MGVSRDAYYLPLMEDGSGIVEIKQIAILPKPTVTNQLMIWQKNYRSSKVQ